MIIKEYEGGEGVPTRACTSFLKRIVRTTIPSNIVCPNQEKILIKLSPEEKSPLMGRVLRIREVDRLPFDCILSGKDIFYYSGSDCIAFEKALALFKKMISKKEQYAIVAPEEFFSEIETRTKLAFGILEKYFKSRFMRIAYLRMEIGIDITSRPVPVWIGEGVIPRTAVIFSNQGKTIDNCWELARMLFSPIEYEKEVERYL